MNKLPTCTISLTKLNPPGPIIDPASKYPVMTYKIFTLETVTKETG